MWYVANLQRTTRPVTSFFVIILMRNILGGNKLGQQQVHHFRRGGNRIRSCRALLKHLRRTFFDAL